jgi:hypothetical protein
MSLTLCGIKMMAERAEWEIAIKTVAGACAFERNGNIWVQQPRKQSLALDRSSAGGARVIMGRVEGWLTISASDYSLCEHCGKCLLWLHLILLQNITAKAKLSHYTPWRRFGGE